MNLKLWKIWLTDKSDDIWRADVVCHTVLYFPVWRLDHIRYHRRHNPATPWSRDSGGQKLQFRLGGAIFLRPSLPRDWRTWAPISSHGTDCGRGTGKHGACFAGAIRCSPKLATSWEQNAVWSIMYRSWTRSITQTITWFWAASTDLRLTSTCNTLGSIED